MPTPEIVEVLVQAGPQIVEVLVPGAQGPIGIADVSVKTGATYTFAPGDRGDFVEGDSPDMQIFFVPPNSDAPFAVGAQVTAVQIGAGKLLIQPGAGVTIHSHLDYVALAFRYGEARLYQRAIDEWVLTGDLGTISEIALSDGGGEAALLTDGGAITDFFTDGV